MGNAALARLMPVTFVFLASTTLHAGIDAWESAAIRPVAPDQNRHSIHAYFNTSPESPDGRHIVYYTSASPDGERGDLRVIERATGKERLLVGGLATEDAHRAACQQWAGGGEFVVFHQLEGVRWSVRAVNIASGEMRILAEDRQLGFGAPKGRWVPVYGCHWNPGPYRDLELIDVATGERTVAVTAKETVEVYGDWIEKKLGSRDLTIFFPVMSPDESRVFFKPCIPGGGSSFVGMSVSHRAGKVVYDLRERRFLQLVDDWGHPSWSPDSRAILEKNKTLFDVETGKSSPSFAPSCFSDHPSLSPDGSVFVNDANVEKRPFGKPGHWAIGIGSTTEDRFVVVDVFDNSKGAKSWRHSHPHPAFSADGKRVYYNVNDGPWTRLMVAEVD